MTEDDTAVGKPLTVILEIEEALTPARLHDNEAGHLLTTIEEIVACLAPEGRVTVVPVADCVRRNPHCGRTASSHRGDGGACIEPGCPCGPGGWR